MNKPMNLPSHFSVNGRHMKVFGVAPQAHNHLQITLGVREPMVAACVPSWFLEQGHGAIKTSGLRIEFIDNEEPPRPL